MRRAALRVLAIAAGGLLAMLLIEIFLRLSGLWVGRHSDTMFSLVEHDDMLGWRMKRDFDSTVDLVDVEGIPVASNSLGFWDREWSIERSGAACRVVFLGDSFTWGLGVRREERFSDLAAASAGWESLNFGVPGFGADQTVLTWESEARRFHPQAVVLTIYHNDYADDLHLVRYGRRKPFFLLESDGTLVLRGVPVDAVTFWQDGVFNQIAEPYASAAGQPTEYRSRLAHWLVKNSNAVRAIYTAIRGGPRPPPPPAEATEIPAATALGPLETTEVSLLVALVARLRADVEASGAHLMVVFAGPPSSLQRDAGARLAAAGLPLIDATTPHLAGRLDGEAVYLPYSGHWTAAAHRSVAAMVRESIDAEGWCPRSR